ncbi:MAG: hypothetical protein ACLFRA_00110 [Alphaproteobacteria bacterium]
MTVYVFIWLSISLFLLVFWVWTLVVVLRQKTAWKVYAEKRKMRFHDTGFFSTPSEHSELDERSQRRLTALEVSLQSDFPFACALGSGGMVSVVNVFDIRHEYKPLIKGWDNSYVLRTSDIGMARAYFTDERLEKLIELMNIEKAWVIMVFVEDRGVLRLDTPYPIDNPKELDRLINQLVSIARLLELRKGEAKDLFRKSVEKNDAQPVLDIDEDILSDHLGLELEDDEAGVIDPEKIDPES